MTDAAIGVMPGEAFGVAGQRLESEPDATGQSRSVVLSGVTFMSPTYFRVTHMSLLEGRVPEMESEVTRVFANGPIPSPPEIVVNRSLAEALWPHESAVGKRVRSAAAHDESLSSTVVGVVEDTRMPGPRAAMDRKDLSAPGSNSNAVRRAHGDRPGSIRGALARAVLEADPSNIVYRITIGEPYLRDAMAPTRFAMALLAAFSGVALLLSAIGLYGVIAYTVTQRTRKIGIRIALGAAPGSVMSLVVRSGINLTLMGVTLGVAAAAGATRVLEGMLYGVHPVDPTTFAAIVGLVVVIALAAFTSGSGGPRASIRRRRCARTDARGQLPVMRMRLEPFVSLTIVFASACSSRDPRIVAGTNDSLVVNVPRLLIVYPVRFHPPGARAGLRPSRQDSPLNVIERALARPSGPMRN